MFLFIICFVSFNSLLEGCYYNKVTILPELVGLNAYEVYRQLIEKDP